MGMGKKLDALLRRSFKTSKFKATAALAISRAAVLKNQHRARYSVARSDVVELLNTGNHDRALFRVEQVIKEQNMLDVLALLEGYCQVLVERITLIEQEKICPEELKEAVSSLIYASTRCGEFPELQEIRALFTSRYGKDFAVRAVELRNHCGVSPKVIQKLSTRLPRLDNKLKVLKEIASDNNIDIPDEALPSITVFQNSWVSGQEEEEKQKQKPGPSSKSAVSSPQWSKDEDVSDSVKLRRRYTDVADAAQAAFESAAYAAEAARIAVELSRSGSTDPDDPISPSTRPRKILPSGRFPTEVHGETLHFEKIHPEGSFKDAKDIGRFESSDSDMELKRSHSGSSVDSIDDKKGATILSGEKSSVKQKDVIFDESDDEEEGKSWIRGTSDLDTGGTNDSIPRGGLKFELGNGRSPARFETEERNQGPVALNLNRTPISVRTRWANRR